MHNANDLVASFLVNVIWQIALIAAAGWLAVCLLKRLGPQVEHVAWVFTLMAAVLAPVFSILPWAFVSLFPPAPTGLHGSIIFDVGVTLPQNLWDHPWVLAGPAVRLCVTLYFGSLLYFLLRLSRAWFFAAKLLREAGPASLTPEQVEQWTRCQQWFLSKEAQILSSAKISSPVVLGLRRPVLLLPADFASQCSSQDFLVALAHECAHIQRRDFKKNLFYEIASLIVAFHPAIWFIKSQIAQTREMVCDAMVTETLVEPRSYAHSLLRLAAVAAAAPRIVTIPAIGIFDANILEKRIMRMKIKKQSISQAWKYGLVLPSTLFLFSIITVGASLALDVEQQPSTAANQDNSYGHVYKIGKGVSAPSVLHDVPAEFPKSGLKIKAPFQQIVIVGLIVDAQGNPHDVHVVKSYEPDFDAQAIKTVEQFRFKAAERAGKPVAVALNIEVNFKKY